MCKIQLCLPYRIRGNVCKGPAHTPAIPTAIKLGLRFPFIKVVSQEVGWL